MIREAQRSELPAILELWLESTTWGHPFIKANYWRDCIPLVRDAYLANAQNWVWEEDSKLLGFVSIMEGRFLAAMFVAPRAVRRGIGKALMQYVQQRHPHLMLEVYQKINRRSIFTVRRVFTLSIAHGRMKPNYPPGL